MKSCALIKGWGETGLCRVRSRSREVPTFQTKNRAIKPIAAPCHSLDSAKSLKRDTSNVQAQLEEEIVSGFNSYDDADSYRRSPSLHNAPATNQKTATATIISATGVQSVGSNRKRHAKELVMSTGTTYVNVRRIPVG
jgi:hypothetical protein